MGKVYVRKPEVLLEANNGWSLERCWDKPSPRTIRPDWFHDNTYSYVKHRCPGEYQVPTVYVWPDVSQRCWRCLCEVPDGIKGIWLLHNWEAIQNEG